MGIIGLGTIGLHMAKIAKGFGMKILGYSRSEKPEFKTLGVDYVSLETVLKEADVLMLAVPLSPSTQTLSMHPIVRSSKKSVSLSISPEMRSSSHLFTSRCQIPLPAI